MAQTNEKHRPGRLSAWYGMLRFGHAQQDGLASSWIDRLAVLLRLRQVVRCPRCQRQVAHAPLYRHLRLCPVCGYHFPISAQARIKALVDSRSFSPLVRERESVIAGTARIEKQLIVLIAFDFGYQGGTLSVKAGEIVARAFDHAASSQLPVIGLLASGGVRIQEGMPALLQMAKTTVAVQDLHTAGRPFIAVLTHPTTGGVYASFGNLADVLVAEPGALIGFAGPRVVHAATGEELAPDSHRAEFALQNGMIDAVVPRDQLRDQLARLVALHPIPQPLIEEHDVQESTELQRSTISNGMQATDVLALARHPSRPTAADYIPRLFSEFFELHGDRVSGDDPKVRGGLARFDGAPVMVIAQMRSRGEEKERGAGPAGYRKAERLVRLAGHLGLPIVSLVDTPGADPGYESEKHGIAGAIAHMLDTLLQTAVPTVSIIIGEGTSGGALAFAATDRVLMQQHAIYSVISPEGAAAILFGDGSEWKKAAALVKMTAGDLLPRGIVDCAIPEPGAGAHTNVDEAAEVVSRALRSTLAELLRTDESVRLAARRRRYRQSIT